MRRQWYVEDDEESIDEEQLEDYEDMVEQLGSFPDKVKINSLSMVAEDHADSKKSAMAIYNTIRKQLLGTSQDKMLPLVYVLDSILKNAKGEYIPIVEDDAANWIPEVHRRLHDSERIKLQKVWRTWSEFKIFSTDHLRAMGLCFDERVSDKAIGSSAAKVAGISRTKDGSLLLPSSLRREMQNVLDDMQNDIQNELDKVSLERLAELNPDLLANIKQIAEDAIRHGSGGSNANDTSSTSSILPAFFAETRPQDVLDQSKAWSELSWNPLEGSHDVVSRLQQLVREGASPDVCYTRTEVIAMTDYLATASATASLVTAAMERLQNQADRKENKSNLSFPGVDAAVGSSMPVGGFAIDKSLFSNDGIKQKNAAVVSILYEVGLPFMSSADGRRFRTQLELSKHLDALFKRNQLEKAMARTEERGWYATDLVWTFATKEKDLQTTEVKEQSTIGATTTGDEFDPDNSTVPADEMRDRCVICGINFKMFFDNEEGMYKYSNCREIEVLNDEVVVNDSELMLVHITCWRGLGSPEVLTMDQALQETIVNLKL